MLYYFLSQFNISLTHCEHNFNLYSFSFLVLIIFSQKKKIYIWGGVSKNKLGEEWLKKKVWGLFFVKSFFNLKEYFARFLPSW